MPFEATNLLVKNQEVLPFQIEFLPDRVLKKCETELKETSENKLNGICDLRKMIKGDNMICGINFEEDFLIQYLRHSKYDTKKALRSIRHYVNLRRKRSEMFESLPDDFLFQQLSNNFLLLMPKRSPDGCAVILFEIDNWNLKQLSFEKFLQLHMMLFTQLLRDPMNQINGFRVVYDFERTSVRFLPLCKPQNLYNYNHMLLNCMPTRVKGIHIINESLVIRFVWPIIKQFMSEKIRNRVLFHSKIEDLFEHIPPSVLPTKYGGEVLDSRMQDGLEWIRKANEEHKENSIGGQSNVY